jgi:arginyl-tRNA synthetase
MINLKKVLADDITAGIEAAVTAGEMKALSSIPSVVVEHPENPEHGDYASPIALGLEEQVILNTHGLLIQLLLICRFRSEGTSSTD